MKEKSEKLDNVHNRLLHLIEVDRKTSVGAFALQIKLSPPTLHYITKGRYDKEKGKIIKSRPSFKIIQHLANNLTMSELHWVLTGKREQQKQLLSMQITNSETEYEKRNLLLKEHIDLLDQEIFALKTMNDFQEKKIKALEKQVSTLQEKEE